MTEINIDNYKLTGIIGRGGMGAIYYGEDRTLCRPVAVKMVRPELLSQAQVIDRFRSEAITTAKLNHPNIATVYGLVQKGEALFLIMEFIKGWTLSQVLRICDLLPPAQAISVIMAALDGIGYAHKHGVIHRDLKPTNLMLNENGIVKVMDFGIARVLSGPKYTRTGQLVGTIKYMPPEQIRGEEPDARTDIYALGTVLYKLLTGRVPFSADSDYQLMKAHVENDPPPPKAFGAKISDQLQAAVLKALSKEARDRFANVEQFAEALQKCPENPAPQEARLDTLVDYVRKRHPISVKPLNQQALEALHTSGPQGVDSKVRPSRFYLSNNRIIRSLVEKFPLQGLPDQWKGRTLLIFLILVLFSIGALILIPQIGENSHGPNEATIESNDNYAADPALGHEFGSQSQGQDENDQTVLPPDQQEENNTWKIIRKR